MQCFTDYPVWPQYVANNSSGSLYSTSVTTPAEESDDDSAQILGAIVALFIALLF